MSKTKFFLRLSTVCIILTLSLFALTACFNFGDKEEPEVILYQGTCGADGDGSSITWELNDKGLLKISGSGDMLNFDRWSPWEYLADDITDVIISEGITTIGEYAFSNCRNIKNITIPSTVTSIANRGFYGCSALTTITIPNGVTEIGEYSFASCTGLTSVIIPESVTTLNQSVFVGCTNLKDVTLPSSIDYISSCLFEECTSLTSITIPEGITWIGSYSFAGCTQLTSIYLPSSLTEICNNAFENCSALTSITLPAGLSFIGGYVFNNCTNLTSVVFENVSHWKQNFAEVYIDSLEFEDPYMAAKYLSNITLDIQIHLGEAPIIGQGTCGATEDGSNISWVMTETGRLTISGSGEMSYIDGYTQWKDLYTSIKYLVIEGEITSIGEYAFSNSDLVNVTLPDSITSIGSHAFAYCYNLETIEMPDSVTEIGNYAFLGCSKLKSVEIPSGITSISSSMFRGCTSITDIKIPNGVTTIHDFAFNLSGLTSVTIPQNVTQIGNDAFSECANLTSISIANEELIIDESVFNKCENISNIAIENFSWSIDFNTGELTISGEETVSGASPFDNIWISKIECIKSIVISEGISRIDESAFSKYINLTSITIPQSVISIGKNAFDGCTNLTSAKFVGAVDWVVDTTEIDFSQPTLAAQILTKTHASDELKINAVVEQGTCGADGNNIIWMLKLSGKLIISGNGAINGTPWSEYKNTINAVVVENGVTEIPASAFLNYNNISKLQIADSVHIVGERAFDGTAYADDEANWESGVLYIGKNLYASNNALGDNYTIKNGTLSITSGVFKSSAIKEIVIPESVLFIGDSAFKNCTALETLTFENCAATIDNSAFYGCNKLTSVNFGNGITVIGNYAFYGSSITTANLPSSVTKIGEGAFCECTKLTAIKTGNNITSIGAQAFKSCKALTTIELGDFTECEAITEIASDAFEGCNAIVTLRYGNAVKGKIPSGAFMQFTTLKTVELGNGITEIGGNAFMMCTSLKNLTLGDNITTIGSTAFGMCSALQNFDIPASLKTVGEAAFAGCTALNTVTIPAAMTEFYASAFIGCSITHINVEAGNKTYSSIDGVLFSADGKTLILYPAARTAASYTVPDGTKTIGDEAFATATKLTTVTMSSSVKKIGNMAFSGCVYLSSVDLGNVEEIGGGAFMLCVSLANVNIPDSVTTIEASAFASSGATNVTIGSGLVSLGDCAFSECPLLMSFTVSASNSAYESINANLYTKGGTALVQYTIGAPVTSFTVPSGVVEIKTSAFSSSPYLTTVTLPNSLSIIGEDAFGYCSALTSITIPKSVTKIELGAFRSCTALKSITVDAQNANYTSIDGNLYSKDGKTLIQYAIGKTTTSLTVPGGVTTIASLAFEAAENLVSITLPSGLKAIESSAFKDCSSLTSINIPETVVYIGPFAFSGCDSLENATFNAKRGWWRGNFADPNAEPVSGVLDESNFTDTTNAASLLVNNNMHLHRIENY